MKKLIKDLSKSDNFILFMTAVALFGFSGAINTAIFNNYLSETFAMGNFKRGMLELPREMPGFLVIFVSALFSFMCTRRLAALAHFLAAIGIYLVGHYSTTYAVMLIWLFIFSLGQHLFIPLQQSIGMEFAHDGKTGKRLGQISGSSNLAAIIGSFVIFLGFRFFKFNFSVSFTIASIGLLISSLMLFLMKKDTVHPEHSKFTLRKNYKLYYVLSIIYGTRKQIFLTFAPWVLVTVFRQDTAMVATLLTIGGIIGIGFNPLLGMAIDRFGERFILMAEGIILIFVCLGYGFSRSIMPENFAFYTAGACFIVDMLLQSVGMARSTYLKKIAVKPEDVSQTLTMGVSIDHFFSIAIALISGILWMKLGYQYVFLLGAVLSALSFFASSFVNIKQKA